MFCANFGPPRAAASRAGVLRYSGRSQNRSDRLESMRRSRAAPPDVRSRAGRASVPRDGQDSHPQRQRKPVSRLSQETNPELVQQRCPSDALVVPSRNRGKAPSQVAQLQMLVDWGRLPTDERGRKKGLRAMEAEKYGHLVSPGYTSKLVSKISSLEGSEDSPLERKEQSNKGVPTVLTPTKQLRMHELADQWDGEWSNQDMATALNDEFGTNVTAEGIGYHCNWVLPGDWDLRANVRAQLSARRTPTQKRSGCSRMVPSATLASARMGRSRQQRSSASLVRSSSRQSKSTRSLRTRLTSTSTTWRFFELLTAL